VSDSTGSGTGNGNGPVRRRRIAGEAAPATPAKKAPAKRVAKKPVVAKPASSKPASAKPAKARPAKAAADATRTAAKKGAADEAAPTKVAAKKTSAKKTSAKKASAKKTSATKVAAEPVPQKAGPARDEAVTAVPSASSAAPAARRPTVVKPVVPKVPTRTATAGRVADDASHGSSRPGRRDLLWLVPATLLALAALAAGVYLVLNPLGSGGDVEASDRQAASAAAGAAETIFSYRYDELDEHLTESKALMTPAFAKEFDKIAPALTELAPQRKIVVEAAAREAAALPCGDDCSSTKADVLVFVDQARLVGDAAQPTVFANRIKVSMVKGDDGWRVANIRAL
jgi:Mce-associated membrane protein